MDTLFVMQGRDRGKRFDLRQEITTLGRDSSCDIQLQDSEVSRVHAEIRRLETGYVLVDRQSSNGSFVNQEPASERVLQSGDRLQLGKTLLVFTPQSQASERYLAHDVNIVPLRTAGEESRIIKSAGPAEGSQLLDFPAGADSPWLARARSNLQVMYRTALAVSHTLDIDQLLQRILELIFEWVEADRGCVMLRHQETGEVQPAASRNRKGVKVDAKLSISRTILDYVLEHKEGVLTSDAGEDQRWDPAQSIVNFGVREAICVPMQGRYGIVGVIYVDTYTSPGEFVQNKGVNKFSEEHLKLMVAIGHQAALAVEDTSYYSAMVQAERLAAMGQTIATLSHHIKNILQGIRGGSFLIDEGLKTTDNEVVRKGWRIVERNQERISNLVMDMLSFSKEREPELVSGNLYETIGDVVELMKTRAKEAQVQLVWEAPAGELVVHFDPDLLHRAILNVVTNAIDACEKRENGKVEVTAQNDALGEKVRVVVADNGEGIAPEDIKKIFSVFESRKGSRGTGLGLPVSQKILREHGGDILVESRLGGGSRFILELPNLIAPFASGTEFIPLPNEGSGN